MSIAYRRMEVYWRLSRRQYSNWISKCVGREIHFRNRFHVETLFRTRAGPRPSTSFASRTAEFLALPNRYLNPLIPTPASSMVPPRKRLKNDSFSTLKRHGSRLLFKSNGKRRGFYYGWQESSGFEVWLTEQESAEHSPEDRFVQVPAAARGHTE